MSRREHSKAKHSNKANAPIDKFDQKVLDLFAELEPFFEGILVTMKQFTMIDRATYQNTFQDFLTDSGSNFYEQFIAKFRERLKQGFTSSMDKIKDIPMNEDFPKHIKEDLDRWEYAKSAILVLFKPLDYAMANGASTTIDMIVKDKWNTDYLQTLNDQFSLTSTLANIFSDSRRSGNKMSVLPVKNILMLYKRENLQARGQKPLIKLFEEEFVKTSKNDYETFATEFFEEGIHGFLPKAKSFIEDEEFRITNAMDEEIGEEMKKKLHSDFLNAVLDQVFEKFDEIIEQDKEVEFQAVTKLFEPIGKIEIFADKMKASFIKQCQQIFENEVEKKAEIIRDSKSVVEIIFGMLEKLEYIQQNYFLNNVIFKGRLDQAFKEALSDNKLTQMSDKKDSYFARLLATYTHMLLKKGSKVEPDQEKIKVTIKKIGKLLHFTGNIDLFVLTYQKNFQDRLILDQVENIDNEMYMIFELQNICDRTVSHKLQTIYNEHQQGNDIVAKFKGYALQNRIELPKFDFTISVFNETLIHLPQADVEFNAPAQLTEVFEKFVPFYVSEYDKKISMNCLNTHGVLQFNWSKRKIELMCKYYQMGILLLFNTHEKLTYAEISEKTKLTGDHLGASLSGIVSKDILSCSTPGRFEPTSVFCFNLKYKPKTTKPNVMQPDRQYLEKQEKQRNDEIEDELESIRTQLIQAKLVRLMKTNRTMKYVELLNMCIELLRSRFNLDNRMVKVQIEELIAKEYFERSEDDRNILNYRA